jgi:hypothetical protein
MNSERAMEILKNRMEMAEESPYLDPLDEWWDEMPKILSQNQQETEKFLSERTSRELFFLSEIFDDIAYEFKTPSFIQFLRKLHEKHPDAELEEDIRRAEEAIE